MGGLGKVNICFVGQLNTNVLAFSLIVYLDLKVSGVLEHSSINGTYLIFCSLENKDFCGNNHI